MKRTPLKPGKPLKRKARLKSGGKPLPRKSKTNSRPNEDLKLQAHYRAQNPTCELSRWFRLNFSSVVGNESAELHHINSACKTRPDVWTNFIVLSYPIHHWCQQVNPIEGKVVCLWWKLQKNELNLSEFRATFVMSLAGWLNYKPVKIAAFVPLWEELLAHAEQNEGEM